jgi:hypothetical protein
MEWEVKGGSLSERNPFSEIAQGLSKKGVTHSSIYTTLAALSLMYDIKNADVTTPTVLAGFNALRSAAVHVDGGTKLAPLFLKLLKDSSSVFRASFILEADLAERVKRLQGRRDQQTRNDMKIISEPERVLRLDDTLLRLGVKYLGSEAVDTTNLPANEVADLLADRYFQIITNDI